MKFIKVFFLLFLSMVPLIASQTPCGVTYRSNCSDPSAPCCSQHSYCGSTTSYCGNGCQSDYSIAGSCNMNISSAPAPSPSPTNILAVMPTAPRRIISSTQGQCGIDPSNHSKNYGKCLFTNYCCSPYGYCGVDQTYCVGCQKDFGYCPTVCNPAKPCGALGWTTLIVAVLAVPIALATLMFELFKCCQSGSKD